MMRLYFDENVQGPILRGLRQRGIDILTAVEDEHDATPDPIVMDRAGELGRVLFSQDEDMLAVAAQRQAAWGSFSGLIYAHQDTPVGPCVEGLHFIVQIETLEDYLNRVQYLPL